MKSLKVQFLPWERLNKVQLSGNTSDFSALNHQVEMAEYSEVPYSRPVFFPSMKISREKNGIYSVDESMRAGDERKFEKSLSNPILSLCNILSTTE